MTESYPDLPHGIDLESYGFQSVQTKFITFFLGKDEYGFNIENVQEIIGIMPITRVPQMPDYIKGVVNLRGKIIPVLDLRLKFGMDEVAHTAETCIIVVVTQGTEMGVIVDRVSEVMNIQPTEIESVPKFGDDIDTENILGIGKAGNRVNVLLDIDRVLMMKGILDPKQPEVDDTDSGENSK